MQLIDLDADFLEHFAVDAVLDRFAWFDESRKRAVHRVGKAVCAREKQLAPAGDEYHHRRRNPRIDHQPARGALLGPFRSLVARGRRAAAAEAVVAVPLHNLEGTAGEVKTSDLVLSALVRARFCELLSMRIPRTQSDLFLVGMVSMMDAILDIPMAEVLDKIAIDQDTKCVLSGHGGRLQPVYELMLAQEAGDWGKAKTSATRLRVGESEVGEWWWQAMQWARQVSSGK